MKNLLNKVFDYVWPFLFLLGLILFCIAICLGRFAVPIAAMLIVLYVIGVLL